MGRIKKVLDPWDIPHFPHFWPCLELGRRGQGSAGEHRAARIWWLLQIPVKNTGIPSLSAFPSLPSVLPALLTWWPCLSLQVGLLLEVLSWGRLEDDRVQAGGGGSWWRGEERADDTAHPEPFRR